MSVLPVNPFDSNRFIGTVTRISGMSVTVNLPLAANRPDFVYGEASDPGRVGTLAVIECDEWAVLARLEEVRLPDRERALVDQRMGDESGVAHPAGVLTLLAAVSLTEGAVTAGVPAFPRLADRVYTASSSLIEWLLQAGQGDAGVSLPFAHVYGSNVDLAVTPDSMFGRHCAVVGTTGGGKSWTVASLVEQCSRYNAKLLLLDATGEYRTLNCSVRSYHYGTLTPHEVGSERIAMPYHSLSEGDLFAIFRPSGQAQAPKLRAAMRSLKLARIVPALATGGVVQKAGRSRGAFDAAYRTHAASVDGPEADFDISALAQQIECECVWPTPSGGSAGSWGGPHENERSFCINLVMRVEQLVAAPELEPIFRPGAEKSFAEVFDTFMEASERILRVSLHGVSDKSEAKKLVVNAMGRELLTKARQGRFVDVPLVVCIDEAHNFLNGAVGDEQNRWPLDAFEVIAKEGRKYGLTLCLATQRPRDLPEGVVSQIGTIVAHRLINAADLRVVASAASDVDERTLRILPTLSAGRALLLGVGLPFPVVVQVKPPSRPPVSGGPSYQSAWAVDQ